MPSLENWGGRELGYNISINCVKSFSSYIQFNLLLLEFVPLLEQVKDLLVVLVESSHAVQLTLVGTQEIFIEIIWQWIVGAESSTHNVNVYTFFY